LNASLATAALQADWGDVVLPDKFVLVGHSAGGGFAPGVAGYYAEGLVTKRDNGQEAPNQLAGVLMYDGVPTTPVLPNAMERLKALEAYSTEPAGAPDPDFVPVEEIGAPTNFLNSTSKVNDELSAARPNTFVGVVLDGGVHMDSMQGGNPLIQFAAYLVAGFPQPQNPPAVQELSVGWITDMFQDKIDPATGKCLEGVVCQGLYGDPGGSFPIVTGGGEATAVVIDSRADADAVLV
jgi:pimeloyl-ACP methyl ester carboxylesterase